MTDARDDTRTQKVQVMVFKPSGKWVTGGPTNESNQLELEIPYDDYLHRVWDAAFAQLEARFGQSYHFLILATPGHPGDHPTLRVG